MSIKYLFSLQIYIREDARRVLWPFHRRSYIHNNCIVAPSHINLPLSRLSFISLLLTNTYLSNAYFRKTNPSHSSQPTVTLFLLASFPHPTLTFPNLPCTDRSLNNLATIAEVSYAVPSTLNHTHTRSDRVVIYPSRNRWRVHIVAK